MLQYVILSHNKFFISSSKFVIFCFNSISHSIPPLLILSSIFHFLLKFSSLPPCFLLSFSMAVFILRSNFPLSLYSSFTLIIDFSFLPQAPNLSSSYFFALPLLAQISTSRSVLASLWQPGGHIAGRTPNLSGLKSVKQRDERHRVNNTTCGNHLCRDGSL